MGKIALITGSSRGIGAEIARVLASEGFTVAVNYHKSESAALSLAEEICESGGTVEIFKADVSDFDAARALIDGTVSAFGGLDVLVNNAGVSKNQLLITNTSESDFDEMLAVNLKGVFACCRAAVPVMVSKKSGKIINISSVWGVSGGSCEVAYSASKAGVIGLTRALAKEVGPSGITVNCVAPGVIDTDMNSHLSGSVMASLASDTPLSRIGTVSDVARAVAFLASDKADFITGQVISVDGGFIL